MMLKVPRVTCIPIFLVRRFFLIPPTKHHGRMASKMVNLYMNATWCGCRDLVSVLVSTYTTDIAIACISMKMMLENSLRGSTWLLCMFLRLDFSEFHHLLAALDRFRPRQMYTRRHDQHIAYVIPI